MKLTKGTIIGATLVVCVLAAAFFLPDLEKPGAGAALPPAAAAPDAEPAPPTAEQSAAPEDLPPEVPDAELPEMDASVESDPVESLPAEPEPVEPEPVEPEPVEPEPIEPEPVPVQPQEPADPPEENTLTCTLSINCSTILDNMALLTPGKEDLVPEDGWLLPEVEVEFEAGESVFDVLVRELRQRKMHFEYSSSALYNSAYIEGICNLYEYDCGELSGWEYAVNGQFMSCSCSEFILSDGDAVLWIYTCDLGADIGDVISR